MGKVFARPSKEDPNAPWFGQTEMLEDNDVIDHNLPPRHSSPSREGRRNSLYYPVEGSHHGNYLFGDTSRGRRRSSFYSNRAGRSRGSPGYGILGHPEINVSAEVQLLRAWHTK